MAGIFDGLSDFIYHTGENIGKFGSHHGKIVAKNPFLHTAAVGTAGVFGGPIGSGLMEAGLSRAEGKPYDESIGNGVMVGGLHYGGSQMFGGGSASPIADPRLESGGAMANGAEPAIPGAESATKAGGFDFTKLMDMMPKGGSGGGQSQQQKMPDMWQGNPFSFAPNPYAGGVIAADPNYSPEREKAAKLAAMLRGE